MKILFIHQNFPAQFKHLAPTLCDKLGHEVKVLTLSKLPSPSAAIEVIHYTIEGHNSKQIHPWLLDLETKTLRGEAAFKAAMQLKQGGYFPDVIIAHPGWGESLFLKDVWPTAKIGLYCEYYYGVDDSDTRFDPEFERIDETEPCRLRLKNANHDLQIPFADGALTPTHYQQSVFPQHYRNKIKVIHDGIDTTLLKPLATAELILNNDVKLNRDGEIITFVNRNLEPMRGYHIFMRALPDILRNRPKARVIIVGGDDVSYGSRPPEGKTWKSIFLDEVRAQLDMSRVHFVGKIAYPFFIQLLQISTVHVYLTYPFVLSWSLLEAMSVGCAIVASNTAPVREAITDNETGLLVDFFDKDALVASVCELLANPSQREQLGAAARQHIVEHYDLRTRCLPKQIEWINSLIRQGH